MNVCRYLKGLCVELDRDDLYGFFDPQSLCTLGKTQDPVTYMCNAMMNTQKQVYMAPFING